MKKRRNPARKPSRRPAPKRRQPKPLVINVKRSLPEEVLVNAALLCMATGLTLLAITWFKVLVH